jgi:periplasmic copper chaperone A
VPRAVAGFAEPSMFRSVAATLATIVVALAAAFSPSLLMAQAQTNAPLTVKEAWLRKPPGVDAAAVYFTVKNTGPKPVTIIGATSTIATHVMIHESATVDGMSRMRMKDKIVVPAGQTVAFAPEGLHVMLNGFKYNVVVGDTVTLSLKLEGGGQINVPAQVRPLDAK